MYSISVHGLPLGSWRVRRALCIQFHGSDLSVSFSYKSVPLNYSYKSVPLNLELHERATKP